MTTLSELLRNKMDADGISSDQVCRMTGLSPIGLAKVLKGLSFPNARSIAGYVKYLGISAEEIFALKPGRAGKAAKAVGEDGQPKRRGRKAKGPFAVLTVAGCTFTAASAEDFVAFLNNHGGRLVLQVAGKTLDFADMAGLQGWCEKAKELFS